MSDMKYGRYKVVNNLGRGGMAEVYRAYDPMLDRYVAVKVILPHLVADEKFGERFFQEAKLVASLRHPNIVKIHDFGIENDQPYMVMEYLDHGTLQDHIAQLSAEKRTMPVEEIEPILKQIANALDYAHQNGAIHRDIKPANILFSSDGEPVLTDFGIAKLFADTAHITVTGGIVGSPKYMSPEQAASEPVGKFSDIYSLGIVIYEMATGQTPFQGDSITGVLMQHLNTPPPPPRELNPNIPQLVQTAIIRALAKKPDERYASAGDFANTFVSALHGGTTAPVSPIAETVAEAPADTAVLAQTVDDEAPVQASPQPISPAAQPSTLKTAPRRPPRNLLIAGLLVLVAVISIGGYLLFGDELLNPDRRAEVPEIALTLTPAEGQVAAQSGEQEDVSQLSNPESTNTTPMPAPASSPVNSLEDVRKAVVKIEAEGTFVDPEFGPEANAGKLGSGFIIDPSGIAVTNNHVVTGAAILRVWVDGEDNPRNARILGVSECSDLAVIDIDGDGFAYLEWYPQGIAPGLDVYAAGFPFGDSEYTLTKGIVSKSSAGGETNWSSVDYVLEHTAKINPGSSGGPLVDSNGNLIGINYSVVTGTDQNYSIGLEEAAPIIERMRQGENVDSIGVNGVAVYGTMGDTPVYGVWVRSVESGSPADISGLKPGDIIYSLENEMLALDGTMADYCDVLRSRNSDDTMNMNILRWDDLSYYEGQLNGRELELAGYFDDTASADMVPDDATSDVENLEPNCVPSDTPGYIECYDDTYTIVVDVPDYWTEFNGGQWVLDGEIIGVAISAAPSLENFNSYYNASGVFFGASATLAQQGDYVQFLDIYSEDYNSGCTFDSRLDYDDGVYRGKVDQYYDCGGADGYDAYVLAAVPVVDETSAIILIMLQVPKDDTETVEQISDTFLVGDLD